MQEAYSLVSSWVAEGNASGAVVAVARGGYCLEPQAFGTRCWRQDARPMAADDVFLVASVTKPVTAAALMLQVAAGRARLMDRVGDYLPEFTGDGRESILLQHLLTHTSGLPDMLETNDQLRIEHADLSRFVEGACRAPLLFGAGERVSYQSMGTLLAGEIAAVLSGQSLPELMETELFAPSGMSSTILGYDPRLDDRVVAVDLPDGVEQESDWHWNSDYWRYLGAPWGGMHASATDLLGWLELFLRAGKQDRDQVVDASLCGQMSIDQTGQVVGLNDTDRLSNRWGLGWRIGAWGEMGSKQSFSHGGATGTLVGADPSTGLSCVLLTTRPGAPLSEFLSAIQRAVLTE